jgi:regulator of RNase E activity RraA
MAKDLERVRARLFSAVLSDALDAAGYPNQAMHPGIRPLDERLVLCGRARTGLYQPTDGVPAGRNPYELEIKLVDALRPGEVAALATGESRRIAPWGELLSTAASVRGAAGCITDGLTRDVALIREMGFPVFSGGIGPLDSRGRGEITAIDVPVDIGGVRVWPGDLVFGDVDGVVVVPALVEDTVLTRAFDKLDGENATRSELLRGVTLAEVFRRHGIL